MPNSPGANARLDMLEAKLDKQGTQFDAKFDSFQLQMYVLSCK
jgi:hypothetical protein